jgi:hypothetical protein
MVNRGLGRATSAVGQPVTQYRPYNPLAPLDGSAVVSIFLATFDAEPTLKMTAPVTVGRNLFYLLADATNLAVGDYLIGSQAQFFVASMELLRPPVMIRTNAVVTLVRPSVGLSNGLNPPGGDSAATETTILAGWPASVLTGGRSERGDVDLPGDVKMGGWQILLPDTLGIEIRGSDILVDQTGLRHVVISAESNPMGWRIEALQEAA